MAALLAVGAVGRDKEEHGISLVNLQEEVVSMSVGEAVLEGCSLTQRVDRSFI